VDQRFVIEEAFSALEVIFNVMRSINPRFTYLLYLHIFVSHRCSLLDFTVWLSDNVLRHREEDFS